MTFFNFEAIISASYSPNQGFLSLKFVILFSLRVTLKLICVNGSLFRPLEGTWDKKKASRIVTRCGSAFFHFLC